MWKVPWYSGIGSFGSCIERGGVECTLWHLVVGSLGGIFWISKGIPVVGPLPTRPNSMACKWGWSWLLTSTGMILQVGLASQSCSEILLMDSWGKGSWNPIIYRVLAIHLRWLFGISAINSMKPNPLFDSHSVKLVCWTGSWPHCLIHISLKENIAFHAVLLHSCKKNMQI